MQGRQPLPHYHTACKRCGQAIIMQESQFPPYAWGPREMTGKGHDCPQREDHQVAPNGRAARYADPE